MQWMTKYFLFVLLCLMITIPLISAEPIYNYNSKQDGTELIIYSGIRFGYEDREWKTIEKLRSYKGTTPINCVVYNDEKTTVRCIDYNSTSLKIELDMSKLSLVERQVLPISKITKDDKKEELPISLNLLSDKQELTLPFMQGEMLHIGETSTIVQYEVDGYQQGSIRKRNESGIWADVHDVENGDSIVSSTFTQVTSSHLLVITRYSIERTFLPFNTSSIGADVNITEGYVCITPISVTNGDDDGDDFISIVQTNQSDPRSLVTQDYNNIGTQEGGNRTDLSNYSIYTKICMKLNSTGLSWINKTGVSLFGLREGHDLLDDAIADDSGNNIAPATPGHETPAYHPYLNLSLDLNVAPTTPTGIFCDGGSCNQTFTTSPLTILCNGSTDLDNDTITYQIWKNNQSGGGAAAQLYADDFEDSDDWVEGGDCGAYLQYGSSTASSGTGPQSGDSGDAGSNFIFMETSSGSCDGTPNRGHFIFDQEINWDAQEGENITFETNFHGVDADIGSSWMEENSTGSWVTISGYNQTDTDGNNGNSWTAYDIDASGLTGTGYVRFIYTDCDTYQGDAAWDNFNITYSSLADDWTLIGNHTGGSSYSWDITGEPVETYEELRCRAVDLDGSGNWTAYYTESSNMTIDYSAPVGDDCDCSGLDTNKVYNLSLNCVITDDCNMGTGNVSWSDSGSWHLNASLVCAQSDEPPAGETIYLHELAILNITG